MGYRFVEPTLAQNNRIRTFSADAVPQQSGKRIPCRRGFLGPPQRNGAMNTKTDTCNGWKSSESENCAVGQRDPLLAPISTSME